ncbi:hypothetical protein FIBSPDRAFT_897054 [Athelia psychrophila]|uniref:Uncharacterized protein n=1 Tax=Athelia psychrophila TaxID=1759441 RepID=A0A166CPQ8_9AGAM|nr:hypothetical protein FIBSPDRAFT_897054 [Fibularhizoctonia sp. CBS 109695]
MSEIIPGSKGSTTTAVIQLVIRILASLCSPDMEVGWPFIICGSSGVEFPESTDYVNHRPKEVYKGNLAWALKCFIACGGKAILMRLSALGAPAYALVVVAFQHPLHHHLPSLIRWSTGEWSTMLMHTPSAPNAQCYAQLQDNGADGWSYFYTGLRITLRAPVTSALTQTTHTQSRSSSGIQAPIQLTSDPSPNIRAAPVPFTARPLLSTSASSQMLLCLLLSHSYTLKTFRNRRHLECRREWFQARALPGLIDALLLPPIEGSFLPSEHFFTSLPSLEMLTLESTDIVGGLGYKIFRNPERSLNRYPLRVFNIGYDHDLGANARGKQACIDTP